MPDKLDLKKTLKHLYNPPAKDFTLIDVPPMNFLMIDGKGDPNTAPAYKTAVEALYSVAYTVKFAIKKAQGVDFAVMPLEGLWWADDYAAYSPATTDRDAWLWTMMIMQPDVVAADAVRDAIDQVVTKKQIAAAKSVRFESYHEGLSAQIMHIGPYSAEGSTLARMHHEYIPAQGYRMVGKHHEIYLSDPNRTAPEKMKTVLRQPIKPKA